LVWYRAASRRTKEASFMRGLTFSLSIFIAGASLTGCIVEHDHVVPGVPATCDIPAPVTYTSGFTQLDVKANASTGIVGGVAAYAITTNGTGTYSLNWTDPTNANACFTGRITGNDAFIETQIAGVSGHEDFLLIAPNQIGFASVPGATIEGINFYLPHDPVFIDVSIDDSSNVSIYYTDASTGAITEDSINPVAFQSP
jgi:hypothetical protein